MGSPVIVPAYDAIEAVSLDAGTDYYLEIEQTGGAMMGVTTVTIWAD